MFFHLVIYLGGNFYKSPLVRALCQDCPLSETRPKFFLAQKIPPLAGRFSVLKYMSYEWFNIRFLDRPQVGNLVIQIRILDRPARVGN